MHRIMSHFVDALLKCLSKGIEPKTWFQSRDESYNKDTSNISSNLVFLDMVLSFFILKHENASFLLLTYVGILILNHKWL